MSPWERLALSDFLTEQITRLKPGAGSSVKCHSGSGDTTTAAVTVPALMVFACFLKDGHTALKLVLRPS